ncbi:MAG: hypothetical protein ABIJ12_06210 [bacterium]
MLIYILLIFILLITAILMLHIRIRVVWGTDKKLLFIGLGRTGPELDFINKKAKLNLFNIKLKEFSLDQEKEKEKKPKREKAEKPEKHKKYRSISDILNILPIILKEIFNYMKNILSSLIVEELEADIEAGFDAPHITGQVFGYYQAALAAVPGVMNHIHYYPDWTGQSLTASINGRVSLPLYKLVWRTIILLWRLPLRDIYKLAIGTNIRRT